MAAFYLYIEKQLKRYLIAILLVFFRKSGSINVMIYQIFDRKARNSSPCACTVQIWPKPVHNHSRDIRRPQVAMHHNCRIS